MLEIGPEVQWRQPHWNKRFWELVDNGGKVIATLEHPSVWKRVYRVAFGDRILTFRSVGFWQSKIAVRDEATGVDVAEYRGVFGNALGFKTGRVFRWQRRGFWKSAYYFTAADNEDVLTFKRAPRAFRTGAIVIISPSAFKYPEVLVLLAFGFYLMIQAAQQAAAAAAAG